MARQLTIATGTGAGRSAGPRARALDIVGLTKGFGPNLALDGVDLAVEAGQVHALLGENGSGKSTLIKILSGFHSPDEGSIEVGGDVVTGSAGAHGARFVHQDLGLVESMSAADNFALGSVFPARWSVVRERQLREAAETAMARLGFTVDARQLVSSMSPAARTGLAIARALRAPATGDVRLLVLDEPTATLTAAEVDQLVATVRSVAAAGVGVLYVTHHLDEVFDLADVATVLRDGRRVATTPVSELDHHKLITQMVGSELDEVRRAASHVHSSDGPPRLSVSDVASGRLAAFSLEVRPGQIIGIAGQTGSGRESALAAIFGAVPRTGEVRVADRRLAAKRPTDAIAAGIAYLPADRVRLGGVMTLSAAENLTLPRLRPHWRFPAIRRKQEQADTNDWAEKLDVRPARAMGRPLNTFSGGNQQKVLLAKWLRCAPQVLLLDEPTQGVDIGAKATIHRQILAAAQAGAAVLVSSADLDELVALCHQVVVLRGGRIAQTFTGDEMTVAGIARAALTEERAS